MSILVLQTMSPEALVLLQEYFDIDVQTGVTDQEDIRRFIKGKEAVICSVNNKIDKDIIAAADSLRVISNIAVGCDNIDVAAAMERNIIVTRTPNTLEQSVAEFCFAHLLALVRRVAEADAYVRQGKFKAWSLGLFVGHELRGKRLGVIGFGKIGQTLVPIAKGFGMTIKYVNRIGVVDKFKDDPDVVHAELDDVLRSSDFVVLLVSLNDETRHLLTAKQLSLMKHGAFLINMARGPVVREEDLVAALQNKTIAGAGLDVYEYEPKVAIELLQMSNTILTPHIGSATVEARQRMALRAAQNVLDALAGRECDNIIKAKAV